MVYQHPQTYSFACPQAKHTRAVSLREVWKQQGLTELKLRIITSIMLLTPSMKSQL